MYKKIATLTMVLLSGAIAIAATTGSLAPVGVGFYSSWGTSSGSTHYTLVDEASCNGTTDYVNTTTVGARDSYSVSLSSIPNDAIITDISITPCASKNKNSGSSVLDVFYKLNGVNSADAGAYSLSGTSPTSLSATNYSGLSATKNASTTLEIGAVYTSGTGGARLSKIATVVTYTIPAPTVPSNLIVTPMATGTIRYITLNWNDNSSNELGFSIERSLDGTNFTVIASTSPNITSSNNFLLATSTTYYYRVNAFNSGGVSTYSNIASTTTLP